MEPHRKNKKIYWALQGKRNYFCYSQLVNVINLGLLKKNLKSYWATQQLFFIFYLIISSILGYSSFLIFRKIFITFATILTLSFFSSSKIFWYLWKPLFTFCFFLLQKEFDKTLPCFPIIFSWPFLYVWQNIWLIFYTFYYLTLKY